MKKLFKKKKFYDLSKLKELEKGLFVIVGENKDKVKLIEKGKNIHIVLKEEGK